jgi:VWFA-related protein
MSLRRYALHSLFAAGLVLFFETQPQGDVVRLPLIVTNSANEIVLDLTQNEVNVFDDKKELPLVGLERVDGPTRYIITMDTTGSFRSTLPEAVGAASYLINHNRAVDQTAIVSFVTSDLIAMEQGFTSDKSQLLRSLLGLRIRIGQSAVIDAIYVAVKAVSQSQSKSERAAVVLISDGEDRNSFYKYEDLAKLVRETGVQVFVIGMVKELDADSGSIKRSPREKAEKLLTSLAQDSHGRTFFPKNRAELEEAVEQISKSLQVQYYASFQAATLKAGKHDVEMKLNRASEKLKLVTSGSYYIPRAQHQKSKP